MVYSGLDFGQYFELNSDAHCSHILIALTPLFRMFLSLVQMQFLFFNTAHLNLDRRKILSRFGLMHMIATNLCEWLFVLVEEAKHEINHIAHTLHDHNESCSRSNIIGTLVQDVSPVLFPCTIEYSLICAVVLFEVWKSVKSLSDIERHRRCSLRPMPIKKRRAHHFSVDCSQAHRGLFAGIIVIVFTIISLLIYFVLREVPDYRMTAIHQMTIFELVLKTVMTFALVAAIFRMRDLRFVRKMSDLHASSVSLDLTLLVVAQFGVYLYGIFSILGFSFALGEGNKGAGLGFLAEVIAIVQSSVQTLFIMNAIWRKCRGQQQKRSKPGREIITFLLVANMTVWFMSTFVKGHASFRPTHLKYFGFWAWTMITYVSMPLAIFFRFHSTICLFDIWKSAYKTKVH